MSDHIRSFRDIQHAFDRFERGMPLRTGPDPTPKPGHAIPFARLNGAGKVEYCVQFPTGTPIVIATET